MSEDMNRFPGSGHSYLSNAPSRSRLTSFRGYLGQKLTTAGYYATSAAQGARSGPNGFEERQGWRSWAGEKARGLRDGLRGSPTPNDPAADNIETINLFPGWATRRYRQVPPGAEVPFRPFEVEVFVSGYAITHKGRGTISRSQRAFIRVAKGFAALPKLTSDSQSSLVVPVQPEDLTQSTEELLSHIRLPPRPDEIPGDYDLDKLDQDFQRAGISYADSSKGASSTGSPASSNEELSSTLHSAERKVEEMAKPSTPLAEAADMTMETLRRMHANLEERLHPFWSSVLPNRTIKLHLFVSAHQEPKSPSHNDADHKPLATVDVTTAIDGSFQTRFVVDWDQLCQHPMTLDIAFGEELQEHTLAVVAELLPPQPLYATEGPGSPSYAQYQSPRRLRQDESRPTTRCQISIPITHSPIRVISDIDDTVKDSGILFGARAVFQNVFVKDLKDCVVPGMGKWYTSMWERGVRFHYVSNGPFEYVSVLNEFLPMSGLPPGSIKLRSFAGRSLFNGFFSAPAARKRAGVEDILKAFPDSRFFLIGDSGEQDLELYAELSAAYPDNVLAIFIRDVTTIHGVTDPLGDPTGADMLEYLERVASEGGMQYPWQESSTTSQRPSPRRSLSSVLAPNPNKKKSYSLSSIWRGTQNPEAEGQQGPGHVPYFSPSDQPDFSAEPESYVPSGSTGPGQADDGATPRADDAPPMDTPRTSAPGDNNSKGKSPSFPVVGALNQAARPIITEPPKSIAPMSMERARDSTSTPHRSSSSYSYSNVRQPSLTSQQQREGSPGSNTSGSSDPSAGGTPRLVSMVVLPPDFNLMTPDVVTADEKRRVELQMRVWRARAVIPSHIVLKVFETPDECGEAEKILDRECKV